MIKAELLGTSLDEGFYSDLTVVNAARVSFDKQHDEFDPEKDTKLINYLAKHGHWTPFSHVRETFEFEMNLEEFGSFFSQLNQNDLAPAVWEHTCGYLAFRTSLYGWCSILNKVSHDEFTDLADVAKDLAYNYPVCCESLFNSGVGTAEKIVLDKGMYNSNYIDVTLRETVPIFVARQRFKHMIGFTYNEVSRRYVDSDPEFYIPDVWRSRPENGMKQGSGGDSVEKISCLRYSRDKINDIRYEHKVTEDNCYDLYRSMVHSSVAPEQARMVLPQSMLTSYWVTGSLTAFARAYKLRIDAHAQKEIRDLAVQWGELLTERFGDVWKDLIK